MDGFTSFSAPAETGPKKGFFARLFGFGSSPKEDESAASQPSSKAPAVPQSAPVTPSIQHKPQNTSSATSSSAKVGPPVPGSAPTPSRASHISQSSQIDKSPTKAVPRSLSVTSHPSQYPGSPPPDRPEAAMKKIKQRQLDHRVKEFAMDVTKATMCYECDTPFGMLVRRQHCRTCGQIFCGKCTRKTSPGEIPGFDGSIRVCHFCCNILQNPNLAADINKIIDTASTAAEATRTADLLNDSDDDDADAYEEKLLSNTYERVAFSPRPASPLKKARSTSVAEPSSPSSTPPGDLGTTANWTEIEGDDSSSTASAQDPSSPQTDVPQDGRGHPGDALSTIVVETDEQRPEKDAISRFRMQTQIRRKASMQTFAVPESTPEKVSKPSKESNSSAAPISGASSESNSKSDQLSSATSFSSALAAEALSKEATAHLERICSYLISEYGLNKCWQRTILSLAKSACDNLRPQWRAGDRIDIRSHLKIKKIPGGSMDECCYVDGLVFTKNRTQKSMRTDLQSARVLLLGCSIEFERKERIVSFDKLLAQERDYLRMLVSKIASMQPDVILVEKGVARVAQDLIRDAGICLEVNVKPNVLQQIARISQCTILQSTEHVLTANLGVIGHFKIETFTGPWGSKPITYIAGCPRHLFASLIIRGAPDPVLTRVKSVLGFLVLASWNIKLENSLLTDEYATVKSGVELSAGPMSTSWSASIPTADEAKAEVRTATKLGRKLSVSQSDEPSPTTPRQTTSQSPSSAATTASDPFEQPADVSSSALASELSQYLVGPTLLRTPLIPELSLSSSATAKDAAERSAHLALNFSYRSLLSPSPSRHEESMRASRGPLAGGDPAAKIANKMSFGDSSPIHKYDRIVDQHLIYLHSLFSNVTSTQCTPFEWQIIHYYSQNDLTLGQFLETFCFSSRLKCSTPECHKSLMDHERCFMHHDGRVNVAVRPWPPNLPNPVGSNAGDSKSIYTWAYCRKHSRQTPFMVPMAQESLSFSFGKYLELYFYAARSQCRSCGQHLYREHIRYFYFENKVVIFAFEPVKQLEVVVPPMRMKFDDRDSVALLDQELEDIIYLSQRIHERVMSKLTELEDSYLATDAEERAEIQNFRKTQEKEKISFLEKLQKEQEKINTNQTNMFQLAALRRHLYGNVKTWNSMILEHEIRYQKKRQSVSLARKDNSFPAATIAPEAATAAVSIGGLSAAATATLSPPSSKPLASSTDSVSSGVLPVVTEPNDATAPEKLPVVNVTQVDPTPSIAAVTNSADGDSSSSTDSKNENRRSTDSDTAPIQQAASPSTAPKDTKKAGTFLDAFSAFSEILPSKSKSSITDVMEDTKVHIFSSGSASHACTAIYENEPSSIIAFALNSEEYEAELRKFQPSKPAPTFMDEAFRAITSPNNTTISCEWKTSSVWGGPRIRLSCTTHFAHQFMWLRRLVGLSEERFTLSLSRCRSWLAQGGKSGSRFCKTMDGRFILKSIQPIELQGFLAFAPLYFDYFSKVYFQQVPTAIAKTVGIYSVFIKTGKKEEKLDFVVMENLFYGHNIEKTFDLKGSLRSRYATAKPGAPRDVVFMDENLLELMYTDPICVSNEAKALLGMTVWNDTLCLASLNVMDYSLVVGVDEEKNQLVIGIIDYMRTYTWDKQLETWVKQTMGNTKKPTIISPKLYKKRFRNAIWNYFILLPSVSTSVQSGYAINH